MNLSIIIPNYNGGEIMKKNLPFVYKAAKNYRHGKVEIIIPDDPSTDDSEEVIKQFIDGIEDPNITAKTVSNKNKNFAGFSRNVNRGVGLATGDILILLNTDVSPHKNFLEHLIPHFKDHQVFAVGCMDESIENGKRVLRGRGIGKWSKGFLMHSRGEVDKDNTLWASGGSSAFRKKIWDELGGLDELYNPFYWEDIDISYRALKSGYKVVFEKRSIVTHEHELGSIKQTSNDAKIKKNAYRNQFIFVWLNITDPKLLIDHLIRIPWHLFSALKRGDWPFFYGFFSAFVRIIKILYHRRIYTKFFIKTDREVLSQYAE